MPGVLLEREAELLTLDGLLDAAAHGEGALVLIEGPAGIGKTTLLGELRASAQGAGVGVLLARGSELEQEFAFGIVRQLLEPKIAQLAAPERGRVLAGAAGLAESVLAGPGASRAEPMGATAAEAALHGLYWLVVNLAEREPLVLSVDDAQWADRPSVHFLEYLARRRDGLPVLVAVAARTEEPDVDPEWLRALAAEGGVLRPAALSPQAVRSLAREALGAAAPDDVCDACHPASGGNPFLLGELLTALRERIEHGHELSARNVPTVETRGVAALVAGRLATIGGAAPAVAAALAVLGDDAELRHLAALAEVPIETAGEAVDVLAAAMVFSPTKSPAFLHPLLRTAVYGQLGESGRARAHGRAARLLAEAGAPPETFASHVLATDANGDAWAVETLRAAARTSVARGAPEVAVAYLKRALWEPPPAESRPDVLLELGNAEVLSGDPSGVEHLQCALEDASPGRGFARVARAVAQGLIPLGRLDEAVDVFDAAIAQLTGEDRELALELEAEAASAGRMSRSTYPRTAERLRPFAGKLAGETPAECLLLANLAAQQMVGGTAREAAALSQRALDNGLLAEGTSASATVYDALVAALIADDFELAGRYCDERLADARKRGSLRDVGLNLMFRSHLAYRQGRVPDAEADGSAALDAAVEGGYIFAMTAAAFLIDPLIERGELDAAAKALARVGGEGEIPDTWMTDWLLHARGQLRLATGDVDAGLADLEMLGRREEQYLGRNPSVYPYRSSIAIAYLQRGESDEARRLVNEELDLARAWGTPRSIGIALRALGLVKEGEGGIEHLREAVSTLESSRARLELGRALTDLGAALRRAGIRVEARARLRAGMDLAHRCGATVLAERARDELVAAGARPRRLAVSGLAALTASERRVAQMAVEGLTNKQIAQALFVTIRTVEMHLGNTYGKLEISSRKELGSALSDR